MKFDWDINKSLINFKKHGVAFEEAILIFDDPLALRTDDLAHSSSNEQREWLIGSTGSLVLVVVFTVRAGETYRIISARRAHKKERRLYETISNIPL